MKNLNGLISSMAAGILLGVFSAHGQSLAVSLTGTYSGGTAYAYAETTSDYATGYYYDLCTYIAAQGEEDDGTWDFYETSGNCSSTDAEQSWTFTPAGTTDFISFFGQHVEYVDYLVDQIDEYCGFDPYACGDYWDAYEMSVLGGDNPGNSGAWVLFGPPAIGYIADLIEEDTTQDAGAECLSPTSEQSAYYGQDSAGGPGPGYYGTFWAKLNPSGTDFTDFERQIRESITIDEDECYGYGDGRYDSTVDSFMGGGQWDVYCCMAPGWSDGSYYGYDDELDYIGVIYAMGNYYQDLMSSISIASGIATSCLNFAGSQSMQISHCQDPTMFISPPYDSGHDIEFLIGASYMTAFRGAASGTAQ
jgi:hypothetical protein